MQQNFIFGGNTGKSYEDLKTQRAIAQRLMAQNTRAPQSVGEGLNAIGNALLARSMLKKSEKEEARQKDAFADQWAAALGGMGGMTSPSYTPSAPSGGAYTPDSASAVAADAMAAIGKSPEWLRYTNQNAIRNQPLSSELTSAMSFLDDMGITMEVFSGGQHEKGSGKPRTGSTRHDHGNAADVFFYKDGRKLDWANPNDIPIFQEIVRRGRANGLTGVGAGQGYMQAGSMHLGFGNEAVWGADGKGVNAPEWLRSAYHGAGQSPQSAPQQQPTQAPGMQQIAALLQAAQSPYATEGQKAVAQMMLSQWQAQQAQQTRQNDPAYQLDMQLNQARLNEMQNPELKIEELADGRKYYVDPMGQQDPRLVNPGIDASAGNDMTESERRIFMFNNIQEQTGPAIDMIEAKGFDPSSFQERFANGVLGGNWLKSQEGQMYEAAAGAWSESALRLATGAAATPEEYARIKGMYFAQVGDGVETIRFKKSMRDAYQEVLSATLRGDIDAQLPNPLMFAIEKFYEGQGAQQPTHQISGAEPGQRQSSMPSDFATKYGDIAKQNGISIEQLWEAWPRD